MELARSLSNYKVLETGTLNNKCLVLFSSNGLYYPNNFEQLDMVIKKDKFEWGNIHPVEYEKIIFIRDVYKQWYLAGINNEINSVDKLTFFLSTQIKNYDSTFVGSSAGGYASVLYGCLCKADKIISFSGQFNLYSEMPNINNEILHLNESEIYLDVNRFINRNIYYFCPIHSDIDKAQLDFVESNEFVKIIRVKSKKHGLPIFPFAVKK